MTTALSGEIKKRRSVGVVSIGAMAVSALVRSRKWQVISNYKRSFYCCDSGNNLICIGVEEIGRGPFTLLCSSDSGWPENILSITNHLLVRKKRLLLEGTGVIFDLQGASIWKKSLCTLNYSHDYLGEDLHFLAGKAVVDAPQESLGFLIPHFFPVKTGRYGKDPCTLTYSIHKRFLDVVNEVRRQSISFNTKCIDNLSAEVLDRLIGLGYGLTPSGDDFLAGLVMGLYKMGRVKDGQYLANHFNGAATKRTTTVSLTFYRALNQGFVTEPFSELLEVIGSGETKLLVRALERIGKLGATSGWDTLTGILFGISLVFPASNDSYNHIAEAAC
jgi:hypothetical protein